MGWDGLCRWLLHHSAPELDYCVPISRHHQNRTKLLPKPLSGGLTYGLSRQERSWPVVLFFLCDGDWNSNACVAKFPLTLTLGCTKTSWAWFHKSKLCVLDWAPLLPHTLTHTWDLMLTNALMFKETLSGENKCGFWHRSNEIVRISVMGLLCTFLTRTWWQHSSANSQSLTSLVRNNCRKQCELIFINRLLFVADTVLCIPQCAKEISCENHFCSPELSWHKQQI